MRLRVVLSALVAVALLFPVIANRVDAQRPMGSSTETGFRLPFSGPEEFEYLAPTQATDPSQINQCLGRKRADKIAKKIGLKEKYTLTEKQYVEFIFGKGRGGDPESAKLADQSVRIFTNTNDRPLVYLDENGEPVFTVLASYGLFVNEQGLLMSLANPDAPTRKANDLLKPLATSISGLSSMVHGLPFRNFTTRHIRSKPRLASPHSKCRTHGS